MAGKVPWALQAPTACGRSVDTPSLRESQMSTVTPSTAVEQPLATDPPQWDPVTALTAGTAEPVARFRYDVRSGDWWWSPGMFGLHGLTDGEVEPTTDLLMGHKHLEDLAATEHTLRGVLATGEPFCCRHRVVDAQGAVREVLSVGEGVCDADGNITTVHGYFVDLTAGFSAGTEDAVAATGTAADRAVEQRRFAPDPAVEQAKGVLVAAFRLTPGAALELLTWRAEETGTDVGEVSRGLVTEFHVLGEDGLSAARRACAYLGLMALDED
jgi:hypothetical protein